MSKLIYLASPHNDDDPAVREYRCQEAQRACAWLMNQGQFVYSPIAHWHPIATKHNLPHGWDHWQQADTLILARCDEMLILTIDGWDTSQGIEAERTFAFERNIPIWYLVPVGDSYTYQDNPK